MSGTIRDAATSEPLVGATVYAAVLGRGVTSDREGRYRVAVPVGQAVTLRFSFVGYQTVERAVTAGGAETLDVELVELRGEIGEVDVEADAVRSATISGVNRLDMEELAGLPPFLGEADVNQTILLLPGVSSVGDGASGFNVRGGNVDQNLVLIDGSQVFFSSHLFGLFSAFNPDLVESATVYKGGVPARYGGRVASVIDIRQRDGATDRLRGRANVGTVSSRLSLEGPIGDRASLIGGARASYVNWMLGLAERADIKQSRTSFGDVGARLDLRPSDAVDAAVSGYYGADSFAFANDTTYGYRSANLSASGAVRLGSGLTLRPAVAATDYAYGLDSGDPLLGFDYSARVRHLSAGLAALAGGRRGTYEAGVAADYYGVEPGSLRPTESSRIQGIQVEDERGVEAAAYVMGSWTRGALAADLGLRYSLWTTLGPGRVPIAPPGGGRPLAEPEFQEFGAGEVVARYGGFEPRLALRYAAGDDVTVRVGLDRLRQYVHLVSNTTAPSAIDRWVLSNERVRPQVGDQVSAGVAYDAPGGRHLTVEGYYRSLRSLVEYRQGARLLLNPALEDDLVEGRGRAYGLELLLEQRTETLTGWLSYTFSRAERVVDDASLAVPINGARPYPADFDRPHDVSLSLSWEGQPRVRWGANFVYKVGRPITYPTGAYRVGDTVVPSYTRRNQARIPDYHRLDLSLSMVSKHEPGERPRSKWTLAIYNVYARRNAYSVFFRQEPGTVIPQPYRLSTLGAAFPSLSYEFSF